MDWSSSNRNHVYVHGHSSCLWQILTQIPFICDKNRSLYTDLNPTQKKDSTSPQLCKMCKTRMWHTFWKAQFRKRCSFFLFQFCFEVVKEDSAVFSVKTRRCLHALHGAQDIQIIINYKLERKSKHRHINQSNTSKTWQAELKSVKRGCVPIKYLWHMRTTASHTRARNCKR